MKRMALLGLLVAATGACTMSQGGGTDEAALAQCAAGQTVLYAKVTPPSAGVNGASGIADAPAVLSGSGPTSPSTGGSGDGVEAAPPSSTPYASTGVSCVPEVCPVGQVAVPRLSMNSGSSGSATSLSGATAVDPPAAPSGSGAASGIAIPDPPASTSGSGASTSDASDVICTAPPPSCPSGEAPSYAPAGFWHCMPLCDPNNADLVVISYGGIYGNGGVCAGPPPQEACPTEGQVWTWDFLNEAWECEAECDNGQYDQHTFGNQTVCVPC